MVGAVGGVVSKVTGTGAEGAESSAGKEDGPRCVAVTVNRPDGTGESTHPHEPLESAGKEQLAPLLARRVTVAPGEAVPLMPPLVSRPPAGIEMVGGERTAIVRVAALAPVSSETARTTTAGPSGRALSEHPQVPLPATVARQVLLPEAPEISRWSPASPRPVTVSGNLAK